MCGNRFHDVFDTSKQPIRTRYLGHVTGYQPIRDQYLLTFQEGWVGWIFGGVEAGWGEGRSLGGVEAGCGGEWVGWRLGGVEAGWGEGWVGQRVGGVDELYSEWMGGMVVVEWDRLAVIGNRPNQEILVPDWIITSHYVRKRQASPRPTRRPSLSLSLEFARAWNIGGDCFYFILYRRGTWGRRVEQGKVEMCIMAILFTHWRHSHLVRSPHMCVGITPGVYISDNCYNSYKENLQLIHERSINVIIMGLSGLCKQPIRTRYLDHVTGY
eukprot:sb/3468204/